MNRCPHFGPRIRPDSSYSSEPLAEILLLSVDGVTSWIGVKLNGPSRRVSLLINSAKLFGAKMRNIRRSIRPRSGLQWLESTWSHCGILILAGRLARCESFALGSPGKTGAIVWMRLIVYFSALT